MKKLIIPILLLSIGLVKGQSSFSLEDYFDFLNANENMTTEQLLQMHSAGMFLNEIESTAEAMYQDSVFIKYEFTDYEKNLLKKHGFMVTERISNASFMYLLQDIFHKDLPLFISTDAILYTVHYSYDLLLRTLEIDYLGDQLKAMLQKLRAAQQNLHNKYGADSLMLVSLRDVDLYLSIPSRYIAGMTQPFYQENNAEAQALFSMTSNYTALNVNIFGSERIIDFSQFKPRGHYETSTFLKNYFKAMIWFGRIGFYLSKPRGALNDIEIVELKRQITDAFLLKELIEISGADEEMNNIEKTIFTIVGEQDNVTLENLNYLQNAVNLQNPNDIWNDGKFDEFQDTLSNQSFAWQRILSQILISNPMSVDSLVPPSAFMLFGQRFVMDSYILGSVVFDRIKWDGVKIRRMLPKTLDILFALGNNAAAQLLKDELDEYHYASNLAALRYIIDNYDEDFWHQSVYTSWLNLIRKLNPPAQRDELPQFMQTAAWWQEKLNTQLTSWTQLRHDNLLYAKQSYTGVPICSFPYIFVEPFPEFYQALKDYGELSKQKFEELSAAGVPVSPLVNIYFNNVTNFADTMISVTEKELSGIELSQEELGFLSRFLFFEDLNGCTQITKIDGWYAKLHFGTIDFMEISGNEEPDLVVADYHTSASDENGVPVGWVAHAGTGMLNLITVNAELPSGEYVSFTGPVFSYYEYTTLNFKRISDLEWRDSYLNLAERPDWVNLYLADSSGSSRGGGASLLTSVVTKGEKAVIPVEISASNYPNPFNNSTIIKFSIPSRLSGSLVTIKVFDNLGSLVKELLEKELPGGNYLISWDGSDSHNKDVASGVYFYRVSAGGYSFTGKMNLIK